MWNLETISPSALSDPSSNYAVPYYNDDDNSLNHMQNGVPSINVDTALATSNMNASSSSVATTPITPGLVSPSHPGYASSPSLLTVTPPTPSHMLRPVSDVYTQFPSSAPVSPYLTQGSPWHISNAVRILSFVLLC
jgi:hypothetical protein